MSDTDIESVENRQGFRGAWANRPWRWLLGSVTVSSTGDHIYLVALAVWLFERTGSVGWVSAAVIVRMVPLVALGPLGGVVAARVDRRRLMVSLDAARFVTLAAMAIVASADGSPFIMVALAALTTSLAAGYRPAAVAATPQLVGEDDLAAANAAGSIVEQLAWFVGPALGAAILAGFSVEAAFLVNAASFAVAAAMVARIGSVGGGRASRERDDGPIGSGEESGNHETEGDGVVATARYVLGHRGLMALLWFGNAALFTFGIEQVLYIIVAERQLGMGAAGVGILSAAIGAGGLLAAPAAARLGGRTAGPALVGSGIAVGVPMMVLGLTSSPVLAVLVLVLEGAGAIVFEIVFITLLQRVCPEQRLAPVYAVLDTASSAALLAGSIAAPLVVAIFGLRAAMLFGGAAVVGATILLAPRLLALAAELESEARRLAPEVERLRGFTIFDGASQATLERLARATRSVSFPAGHTVFREGDEPDDLHLVLDGRLSIWSSGERGGQTEQVNEIGTGEWFGEIGLFRRSPRTATVVADSPCEVLTIDGSVFLNALGAFDTPTGALHRTMAGRLARTHPSWGGKQ